MEREFRFRPSGMMFYLFLTISLLVSKVGYNLLFTSADMSQALPALLGVGVVVFTSDSIGYLFNSLVVFLLSFRGGYARDFSTKMGYQDFKELIFERYKETQKELGVTISKQDKRFEDQWESYGDEVLMAFFYWHPLKHENPIEQWSARRYSIYFTGMSSVLGITVALIASAVLILEFGLGWTLCNTIVSVIAVFIMSVIWSNSKNARKHYWQTVDLWIARIVNPSMKRTYEQIQEASLAQVDQPTEEEAK